MISDICSRIITKPKDIDHEMYVRTRSLPVLGFCFVTDRLRLFYCVVDFASELDSRAIEQTVFGCFFCLVYCIIGRVSLGPPFLLVARHCSCCVVTIHVGPKNQFFKMIQDIFNVYNSQNTLISFNHS